MLSFVTELSLHVIASFSIANMSYSYTHDNDFSWSCMLPAILALLAVFADHWVTEDTQNKRTHNIVTVTLVAIAWMTLASSVLHSVARPRVMKLCSFVGLLYVIVPLTSRYGLLRKDASMPAFADYYHLMLFPLIAFFVLDSDMKYKLKSHQVPIAMVSVLMGFCMPVLAAGMSTGYDTMGMDIAAVVTSQLPDSILMASYWGLFSHIRSTPVMLLCMAAVSTFYYLSMVERPVSAISGDVFDLLFKSNSQLMTNIKRGKRDCIFIDSEGRAQVAQNLGDVQNHNRKVKRILTERGDVYLSMDTIKDMVKQPDSVYTPAYFKTNKDTLTLLVHQYIHGKKYCYECMNKRSKCSSAPEMEGCRVIGVNKPNGYDCRSDGVGVGTAQEELERDMRAMQSESSTLLKKVKEMNAYDLQNNWKNT